MVFMRSLPVMLILSAACLLNICGAVSKRGYVCGYAGGFLFCAGVVADMVEGAGTKEAAVIALVFLTVNRLSLGAAEALRRRRAASGGITEAEARRVLSSEAEAERVLSSEAEAERVLSSEAEAGRVLSTEAGRKTGTGEEERGRGHEL